ncbi:uncharacterized protein LOC110237426 [Exaiptasia diaphana]|uniref:Uncharacterized protein n=1 Tax=Exaiptasia diaphana TaxID=2652724 RepID=A0A913X493_EXADI|nr:uncharacterized protein LOC110237426 [Exaiptasia diaphana]
MPALNEAISQRRFKQATFLINSGVNVNSKNREGYTPLAQLCDIDPEEKALSLAKLFITKGGRVDRKDNQGRNVLMCAILKGKEKLASLFLEEILDFNLNAKDDDGNTALSHASAIGNVQVVQNIVRALRRYGLSVDVANKEGLTPLMIAAKHRHLACANVILTEGKASVFIRDNTTWKTALEWERNAVPRNVSNQRKLPLRESIQTKSSPSSSSPSRSRCPFSQDRPHVQKHEMKQLFQIYENQLTSTYRIGFDNSKIGNFYENICLTSPQVRPESRNNLDTVFEGSQARALFTKSTAVVKFRKTSSMLNARKLTKTDLLSASCTASSVSELLRDARESSREIQPKQDLSKQGIGRPMRRPIRSRSEILFIKNKINEKERKLPRIEKRTLSNPVMSLLDEKKSSVSVNANEKFDNDEQPGQTIEETSEIRREK